MNIYDIKVSTAAKQYRLGTPFLKGKTTLK